MQRIEVGLGSRNTKNKTGQLHRDATTNSTASDSKVEKIKSTYVQSCYNGVRDDEKVYCLMENAKLR